MRGLPVHMRGLPVDLEGARQFADEHSLFLLEDCSHAHGATLDGRLVGTYGDASAWSIGAQKIITAGEGGIVLTRDRSVYDRAQLLGHFNRRAFQEVDPADDLYKYAFTGLGLKYRAHPLGIAFALGQLDELEGWLSNKQTNALRIARIMRRLPGLEPIGLSTESRRSAYYAIVFRVSGASADLRDRLVDTIKAEGFRDVGRGKSATPLHSLPLFTEPVSPVYKYEGNGVVGTYTAANELASTSIKLSVPAEEPEVSEAAANYIDSLERVVAKLAAHFDELAVDSDK